MLIELTTLSFYFSDLLSKLVALYHVLEIPVHHCDAPPKQSGRGSKTKVTTTSTMKQKKIKESEASVPVVIDISKLGTDRLKTLKFDSPWEYFTSGRVGQSGPN